MSTLDLVEMVSDWIAMSQEYKDGSCLKYVEANIEQWGFSEERKVLIFKYIG